MINIKRNNFFRILDRFKFCTECTKSVKTKKMKQRFLSYFLSTNQNTNKTRLYHHPLLLDKLPISVIETSIQVFYPIVSKTKVL